MKLISHHDLNGYGNIGEGVAIHKTRDGRRIFYMAHVAAPKDITSVDVTDINNPKLIAQTDLGLLMWWRAGASPGPPDPRPATGT